MNSPELARRQAMVEAYLEKQFSRSADYGVLLEAMRYSLLAGGKRLRPVLALSFAEAVGGDMELALPAAAAIEMVHTYSLIHDDLPCMDNDDYRRGRLTCHKVFGEAMATLAGDALLTAAFETLSGMEGEPGRILRCVCLLSQGAGEHGMVAGQTLDLLAEGKTLSQKALEQVHLHKTGALIRAACQMGVVLGGGSKDAVSAAGEFAEGLGLAFQIRDDMLDEIGSQQELGKPIGSDRREGKCTFVTLLGLEQCGLLVQRETERAVAALDQGDFLRRDFLRELARDLTCRMK